MHNSLHQEKPMYGASEGKISTTNRRSLCVGLCVYNGLRRSFQYKWRTKRSYMFYNHINHVSITGSNRPIAA